MLKRLWDALFGRGIVKLDEDDLSPTVITSELEQAKEAFKEHKKNNPDPVPYDELTPLQKKMQSGDI
jgi:hypothetical protein